MALSRGIEVNIDMIKKVIALATRLRGNQVFIADEDLITLYLVLFRAQSQFIDYIYGRNYKQFDDTKVIQWIQAVMLNEWLSKKFKVAVL